MNVPDPAVESHYENLERRWSVLDGTNEYARLVVPFGNSEDAIHRWFHLKEAFSSLLLSRVVKDLRFGGNERLRVLDCFAGCGTTLVSAVELAQEFRKGVHVVGIETNPFLYRVAKTKTAAALKDGKNATGQIKKALTAVKEKFDAYKICVLDTPNLSTWRNPNYFSPNQLTCLLALREAIESLPHSLAREVLLLCAAATVEPASKLRRDGRALRYEPTKVPREPWQEFERRVQVVLDDLTGRMRPNAQVHLHLGDGRRPHHYINTKEAFDLVLFSPPYPNNIDYTEIYKTEAWYLRLYSNQSDFRNQRLTTVRSHPSVRYDEEYSYETSNVAGEVTKLVEPLLDAVPADRYELERKRMIRGYADDMLTALRSSRALVSSTGRLAFVVGNSVHGNKMTRFVIAADLIMAKLAELSGWTVEEIRIARNLRRRRVDSPYLRESIVVLRPSI